MRIKAAKASHHAGGGNANSPRSPKLSPVKKQSQPAGSRTVTDEHADMQRSVQAAGKWNVLSVVVSKGETAKNPLISLGGGGSAGGSAAAKQTLEEREAKKQGNKHRRIIVQSVEVLRVCAVDRKCRSLVRLSSSSSSSSSFFFFSVCRQPTFFFVCSSSSLFFFFSVLVLTVQRFWSNGLLGRHHKGADR